MAKNDGLRTWFREIPLESGVSEFFYTASYSRSAGGDVESVLRDALARIPKISEFVSVTVFHPSEEPLSEKTVSGFRELAPTSFVWGRGKGYLSFILTGYSFESEAVREATFRKSELEFSGTSKLVLPSFTKTTLDAFSTEGPFDAQVDRFYDSIAKVMDENELRPEHFVRSWNYVDSILKVYPVFNAVRDRRFDEIGVPRGKCPAGTGIDCVLNGSGMAAFAEFHSPGTASSPKAVTYKAWPQCEALDYGPRFSRAAYVEAAGWRRIHISWTASVWPNGETLNSDDIVANVAHTMETVRELLDIAWADFSHVVRSHAYFKKQEFIPEFDLWQSRVGVDFPVARNVCDVCRADWLFEFECVAFVPVRKASFRVFWEEGGSIGNKADNCRILARSGFPVPPSLALTGKAALAALESGETWWALALAFSGAFSEKFADIRYAVRSSSKFEDSSASSKAWAFRSVTDVPFERVFSAISEVVRSYGEGVSPDDFGVLVQEYVPLETFGVTFTCDPDLRSHAMVCEVSRWPGESLVSGSNVPVKIEFSRNAEIGKSFETEWFPVDWETWRKTFRRIESVFWVPQDVEWGISKNGAPFVFQSRPITTLKEGERSLLKALDRFEVENLPKETRRRLVRNELCEPFDSPTEEEFSFLSRLYSHDTVVSAYARWGISYRPIPFLERIGGKLFIDADKESACFDSGGGLFSSYSRLKNFWNLGAVGAKVSSNPKEILWNLEAKLFAALDEALEFASARTEISEDVALSKWYSAVFETNFVASSWEANFVRFWKKIPASGRPYVPANAKEWKAAFNRLASAGLLWNSLAFSDASVFKTPFFDESRLIADSDSAENAGIAERLDFLREAGRCVSVIVSNLLRPASLRTHGVRAGVKVPQSISVPSVPSEKSPSAWNAVSDGTAEGEFFVWSPDAVAPEFDSVVFVPFLDPALADALPQSTVAVISLSWGRLSHFAIVAREKGLPVFVAPWLRPEEYFGKRVRVSADGISLS